VAWSAFEDTCLGPVAWDLASLDTDGEALAAYPEPPDAASLELFRDVRKLHAVVWVYALLPEFPAWAQYVAPILDHLRRNG
jgi:aminoglycoside/choline kinase family phosphotransferase